MMFQRAGGLPGLGFIALLCAAWPLTALAAEEPAPVPAPFQLSRELLVDALPVYRRIAETGGWPTVSAGPMLRYRDSGPRVAALRVRLEREGYLTDSRDTTGNDDPASFDDLLDSAVRRFQRRNGLVEDGIVGPLTLAALNVSAEARKAQIRLDIERLEHALREPDDTYVAINIADRRLSLVAGNVTVLSEKVIVGRPSTPTPELTSEIRSIVFNPPWNVPSSIARREILPRLRSDPGYLQRLDFVILDRADDPHGLAIDWRTTPFAPFAWRLRQQPGPQNALGNFKFDFPNPYNVYVHDTPSRHLFADARRALSNGCIRLQHPEKLVEALLAPRGWTGTDIQAALATGETRDIALSVPMPIRIVYLTAFADVRGSIHFREDIYRRDAQRPKPDDVGSQARGPSGVPAGPCSA